MLRGFLRIWNEALGWAHDEGNRDEVIKFIAAEEKLDDKGGARELAQLPASGELNLKRVQFGIVPPMGKDLPRYYEESFYRGASN